MFRFMIAAVAALGTAAMVAAGPQNDESGRIVLLHTNDTHSQIDPTDTDEGGILRRKVLIDSIRAAEPNVLLIDAGDAVQGSVYFTLFGGEVERKMMNALGYDIQILGNHEFDNGMERLAEQWSQADAELLSTNYDLSATPLDTLVKPLTIREIGGKRIGFIAINIDPAGLIGIDNWQGLRYLDGIKAANATAWHLKHNERVDLVVALTHIGLSSRPGYNDLDLAAASEDIDIIIGGHSHTRIAPDSEWAKRVNAVGDTILVAQTGKAGRELGEIIIDPAQERPVSKLIKVDSRLDSRIDPEAAALLAPYRHAVDSVKAIKVARSGARMEQGTPELVNLISDLVAEIGSGMAGRPVDMAIMNRGGIRCALPSGEITKGLLMQMMPFDNRITVMELRGSDLQEAFEVMARRGGDGISSTARATYSRVDGDDKTADGMTVEATVGGEPIDPERTYTIATIDYLAGGGDYMAPLTRGTIIAESDNVVYDDVIDHLLHSRQRRGKKLRADSTRRFSAR